MSIAEVTGAEQSRANLPRLTTNTKAFIFNNIVSAHESRTQNKKIG